MQWNKIYKIKDSIDVYFVEDKYLLFYFMNTRVRKKFSVNEPVIHVIEEIDGEKTALQIYNAICGKYHISKDEFSAFFDKMIESKILIAKTKQHLLTPGELIRFDRQLSYFAEFLGSELEAEKAQIKLRDSSIGIIGCGAVGGNIAIQLAMAGVENFVLMDYDNVEESDCTRHLYYDRKDLGRKKVEVLSDKLKQLNKNVKTYISYSVFTPNTDMTSFLEKCTFVVNTADEPYLGKR